MLRNDPPHSRHRQKLLRLWLMLWLAGFLLQPAPRPLLAAGDSPFSSAAVEHLVIPPDGPEQMPVLYVHGWSDDGALFARGQRDRCYDPTTQKKPSGTTYLAGAGLENWIVQWWSTDSDGFAEPQTTADKGYAFLVSAQEAEDQSVWINDGDYTLQNRPCPGALDLLLSNPFNDISNVLIANTYNDSGRVSEHAKDLLDLLRGEQRPGGRLEGARQVNIITHSKGSLVTRAMLHMAAESGLQDAERVANTVYNAPPFAGSSVAPLAITLFFETPLDPEDIFLDEWFIESYGTLLIGEPVGEVIEILLDDLLRISGIKGGLDAVAFVLPPGSLSILEILKTEAWDVTGRAFWGEFAETEEAEAVVLLIELIRPLVTAFMGFPAAPALYDLPPDAFHVTQYNNTDAAKQFITYGTGPLVDFGATLFPCRAEGPFTNPTLPCADAVAADPALLGNPDGQLRNYDDVVVAQGSAILLSQTDGFGPRMTLLDSATIWHGDTVDDPTVFGPKWLEALLAPPTSLVLDGLIEPADTAQRSYVVSAGTQLRFSSEPTRFQHSASGPAAFSFDVTVSAAAYQYRVVKLDGSGSAPSPWVQVGTNSAVSFETLRTTYGLDNVPFALEWRSINGRGGREHIRSARFVVAPPAPQIVSDQIITPNPAEVHRRPISELYGRAVRGTILAQLNNPLLPILQSNPEAQWVLRAPANKAYVAVFSHRGGVDYAWDDPNLSNPTRQENVAALTLPLAGLGEGLHRLTFETFNAVGERSPRQHVLFLVDNTPPAVTFQASANHALGYLAGPNTPLSYSVHDVASNGGTGSLSVPGHPAGVIPPDTVFTLGETTLDEQGKAAGQVGGQVTLNATGFDWVNNSATTSIQVYYDWTPPDISIVEVGALPTGGGYRTFTDTVRLTLNITEQGAGLLPVVAHTLTADGNQLVSDPFVLGGNGGFPNAFAGTARLAPGLNTVTVVAQDSVGNSSTLPLQIEYNQAPFDQEPLELMTPRLNVKCYSPTGAPATCIPGTVNKWDSSFYGDVFAFSSFGNVFVQEDTNGAEDVFVWRNGSLLRASVNGEGEQANDDSNHPAVSGNGRYVYFRSQATNLAPGAQEYRFNLYIKDLESGRVAIISRAANGQPVNLIGTESFQQTDSTFDGRYVVYESNFGQHVAGVSDLNISRDIFLVDLDPDGNGDYFDNNYVTHALSTVPAGNTAGNGFSRSPDMSEDGRYVVFVTQATDLDTRLNTNGSSLDVVLLKLGVQANGALDPSTRTLVPINTNGSNATTLTAQSADQPRVGPLNDTVVFTTRSNIPGTGDANSDTLGQDVYVSLGEGMGRSSVTDRQIVWISQANGSGGPQSSVPIDTPFTTLDIALDSHAAFNYTGAKIGWVSVHDNMEPGDTNGVADMFIRRDSPPYPPNMPVPNWLAAGQPSSAPVMDGGLSPDGRYAYWATSQTYSAPYEEGPLNLYRRRIEPVHTYTLTVAATGGTVTRVPAGVPLGSGFGYSDTAQVALTATPAPGYRFVGWSGVDHADGASAAVAMHHPRAVTAHFEAMQPPTAAVLAITTAEDTASAPAFPAVTDADPGDSHTVSVASQPAHGVASVRNNQLIYLPAADYHGPDSFTIQVTDRYGLQLAQPATVQVTVTPVNDPPASAAATASGQNNGSPIPVLVQIDDPDVSDSYAWTLVAPPTSGAVTSNGVVRVAEQAQTTAALELHYLPEAGFSGVDSFTFRLTDSGGATVTGSATVTVTPGENPGPGPDPDPDPEPTRSLFLPSIPR